MASPLAISLLMSSTLLLGLTSWQVRATSEPVLLAELLVAPEKSPAKPSAQNNREKAAQYQADTVNTEEVGILSPRGGAPSEAKAFDNRNKARAYQQGGNYPIPQVLPGPPGETQARPAEQRNRAQFYAGTGNGQEIDLSHVGKDGIPLVPCHDVDNVSGRIGDDTASGSIVFIVRNNQQIKVRCR